MDFQLVPVKNEPQESEENPQQFRIEGYKTFNLNNQENVSKINPPNSKQCEKCGFRYNSINQITEHINSCCQSRTALSDDEIIKTETEIIDLNLYEVQDLCVEENIIQFQPNQILHQLNLPNENNNSPMLNAKEKRKEPNENPMNNQKMLILNYHNHLVQTTKCNPSQIFNIKTTSSITTPLLTQHQSSTNNDRKSIDAGKSKNYNRKYCETSPTTSCYLKEHGNPTLHKNVDKKSDSPDPSISPINNHHPNETEIHVDTQLSLQSPIEDDKKSTMITPPDSTSTTISFYKCDQCYKYVHNKKKPFNCVICGKGFVTNDYLIKHSNKCLNAVLIRDELYKCNQCRKQFITKNRMIRHRKMHLRQQNLFKLKIVEIKKS